MAADGRTLIVEPDLFSAAEARIDAMLAASKVQGRWSLASVLLLGLCAIVLAALTLQALHPPPALQADERSATDPG